jgi:hypothetical protein
MGGFGPTGSVPVNIKLVEGNRKSSLFNEYDNKNNNHGFYYARRDLKNSQSERGFYEKKKSLFQ